MKKYTFPLYTSLYGSPFRPIRSKIDVLYRLMRAIKTISTTSIANSHRSAEKVHIIVSKMNRIVYESDNKIFSISCPFSVNEKDGFLEFRTQSHVVIDSYISSAIISLLDTDDIFTGSIDAFAFPMIDAEMSPNFEMWPIVRDILMYEDGYLRYDHDEEREGINHPINHLDVFYSNQATFKLGVDAKLSESVFAQILDNMQPRWHCHLP